MKKKLLLFVFLFSVFSSAMAEGDCELALNAANDYFKKGDYEIALKMYKLVVEKYDCGANYGGAAARIRECNRKLKEKSDYERCYSIAGCDYYLSTYPNGKYYSEIQKKRSKLLAVKIVDPVEDDAAFGRCDSESACDDYLQNYPRGRHIDDVLAMKLQYQEEREAFEAALRMEREKEAAKTAFMDIQKIEFANYDAKNNIVNDFDSTLYASDLKYLTPRIVYDGIYDIPQIVTVYCRLFDSEGELKTAPDSPEGYTFSNSFLVRMGENNTYQMRGFGSPSAGFFAPGDYLFELWYQDSLLYDTPVTINDTEDALTHISWRNALAKTCKNPTQSYKAGIYKGQIKGYDRSGLGVYSWNNGSYYIGDWEAKAMDGIGMYISACEFDINNCSQCLYFVGEWSANKKSGIGRCYDKYGNLIYQGDFSNDAPTQAYPSKPDKSLKFECFEYSPGCFFVGETKDGKCHGKGMLIWRWYGDLWYGDFVEGERSGFGVFLPNEGEIYTGFWEGDVKQ